jgi:hypothetical protein
VEFLMAHPFDPSRSSFIFFYQVHEKAIKN